MALRTSLVAQPHLYMGDVTGKPLDYGMVYFGQPNKDPEFYPIDIYYDEALTIAAPQPVRTKGGFLNANGDMVEVYAAETEYSVKVLDGYGRQVFYQESMSSTNTSGSVSTKLPYVGAVSRVLSDKLSESITPKDFGATGNKESDLLSLASMGAATGERITLDDGRSFEVAPANATDNQTATAGGVKLYAVKNAYAFDSRSDFVTAVANGFTVADGSVITAGKVSYTCKRLSKEIIDLPNFEPFGQKEFEHYGGHATRSEKTRATITHHRISADRIFDVTRIVNPLPSTFQAIEHPDMDRSTGISPRMSLREMSKHYGIANLVNSTGFINADNSSGVGSASIKPYGLYISNGEVIADWNTYGNTTRDQVILCLKNGDLVPRYKSDGGTAASYVAEGAVWGFGWGVWCALDGVAQNTGANFAGASKSARTIIGQAENGDYIIIVSEGVTDSYGISATECGEVALQYGCVNAFLCDGGGSSQLWIDDFYALPSSDNGFTTERTLCTAMAIDCSMSTYDTGWIDQPLKPEFTKDSDVGVRYRQVDNRVSLEFSVGGSFTTSAQEVCANNKPLRYMPTNGLVVARGAAGGNGGAPAYWVMTNNVTLATVAGSPSYIAGHASWSTKNPPSIPTP